MPKYGRTIDADFVADDMTRIALVEGEKGEIMLEAAFKTEHGWTRPKTMTVDNWERILFNAETLGTAVDKAKLCRQTLGAVKAERDAASKEFEGLNGRRSADPEVYTDEVYARKADAIKAKYPLAFPKAKVTVDPGGDDTDKE